MEGRTFFIVDVFAERKYAGNQLAVFPEGGSFTDEEMKLLARETNFSEVTFIMPGRSGEGGFNVRIFSLDEELPFAGHPSLGTAYIIQRQFIKEEAPQIILNLPVGPIPVDITYRSGEPDTLFMRQAQPSFGEIINPAAVAEVLNIDTSEIDARYPVQEVSTGLPFIIIPLKRLQVQSKIKVNIDRFFSLVETVEAKSIYVFCPETYDSRNDLNARMFDYYNGIPEDPATGSAAGCLAAYLLKYRYFGAGGIDLRVEQGTEIKRPSLLRVRASERGGRMEINVGGRVIPVAEGRLL
ncbi:MAG TPA: PhzF family phenazine biosynthesis protein [Bacillota bacterium]|nr:PhzF family phenazine biosynthesis protein [Bacillota bacterium]